MSARATPRQRFVTRLQSLLELHRRARSLTLPALRPDAPVAQQQRRFDWRYEHALCSDDDFVPLIGVLRRGVRIDDADADEVDLVGAQTSRGESPLVVALLRDQLHCIEALLARDAFAQLSWRRRQPRRVDEGDDDDDANDEDDDEDDDILPRQSSVLHCARSCGAVRVLLAAAGDDDELRSRLTTALDARRRTPLLAWLVWAAQPSSLPSSQQSDVEPLDDDAVGAMIEQLTRSVPRAAVQRALVVVGRVATTSLVAGALTASGADTALPERIASDECTALQFCVRRQLVASARALVDAGADIWQADAATGACELFVFLSTRMMQHCSCH